MNINFNNFALEIFGGSHDEKIGVVITGFKKGIVLDDSYIKNMMERRRPGKTNLTTTRNEPDTPIIEQGVINGVTTGEKIVCVIKNTNKRSKDYSKLKDTPRPAHADLTAFYKYGGTMDMTGGGPFSGRLTAPMVFAGSIAKKLLEDKGIYIVSHLKSVGKVKDVMLNKLTYDEVQQQHILSNMLPVINIDVSNQMVTYIDEIRLDTDSIGSVIESVVYHMPTGLGEHSDYSIESSLSKTMFCIPGLKGIEFGEGFNLSTMRGSKSNDAIYYDENYDIKTKTNYMGGILGGISNGMPISFNVAMKATASIAKKQHTINLKTKENVEIQVEGRHDPCIGIRAVPVVESLSALVIYDYILEMNKNEKS